MEINGTEYLNVEAVSNLLKVTPGRVRQLIADGELPTLKLTRRLNMVALRDVELFMNRPQKTKGRKRNA